MSLAAGLVNTLTVALAALPLATLLGVALGLRACRPSRWRRGWRPSSSRRCATPGAVAALRLVRPAAAPARRAPGLGAAAVGAAVQSRTGAAGAARLAAASGEPDCRHVDRGLGDSTPAARDGRTRASRTRSAHSRRALAGAGRPAARLDPPARAHRRTAGPARTGPARRLATQHRIRHAGHRPVGVPCRLYRRHRARLGARGAGGAGRGRTGAGAVAPGHPAPRGRAQCRARGAAALRQSVPGADQEQHAGHRHRLPGPDGRHQHRHHADRPGAGRHLAGAGGLSGPGPGAGRRVVRVERAQRPAWSGRSARRAPGRTAGIACRPRGQGGGRWTRRLARTAVLLAALLAAGSLADWALLNAVWRGDAAACAQAAGACWAAVGENLPLLLFGAMQPAHRGPPWSPAPRCCWRSPSRWARAGCPDGHAPASPSPRWRLPPARCPAGPGAARPSARCAGAACWSR